MTREPEFGPRAMTDADFAAVQLLVLDVDGVLTDGHAAYGAGEVIKNYYIPDGMGIVLLQRAGVAVAVLTSEDTPGMRARMEKLRVRFLHAGVMRKGDAIMGVVRAASALPEQTAYISDDINDVSALRQIGYPIATPEAQPEVMALARYVTAAPGGCGAVRDVANRILAAKGLDAVELWERG